MLPIFSSINVFAQEVPWERSLRTFLHFICLTFQAGYKVGRVEQAETALGAEMRLAATKSKGKTKAEGNEKIVRRSVPPILKDKAEY